MIKNLKINDNSQPRQVKDSEVYDYLLQLKNKLGRELKVIDVGGAAGLRIPEYTTHILDFQPEKLKDDSIVKFSGDIELNDTWIPIFDFVEKNGKFDFVICSHTLEDINAPYQVMLNLFKISNAGHIAVPSKFIETYRWENYYIKAPYVGYCHHRWIYTVKNNILCCYPKMGSFEFEEFKFFSSDNYFRVFERKQTEITFIWENEIEIDLVFPYQYYDNFTHPQKKSKLLDFLERDDVDDLLTL